jgi:penicillin amidase
MFQNDDLDLIAEKVNPDNPNQVWYHGQWVDMDHQRAADRGEGPGTGDPDPAPVAPRPDRQRCARQNGGKTPIAMWWAFLETQNPILEGFYQLNRADTLAKARAAAAKVQAPGLNIVWANAKGDIGWWAAAQLPIRPAGVKPGLSSTAAPPGGQGRFYPSAPTRRKRTRRAATSSRPTSSRCRRPAWRFPVTTTSPTAASS